MKTNSNKLDGTEHVSRDIVRLLKDPNGPYGWTLKKIGEAVGCGESFVSMVGRGKRSFTLDHLTMLEKKLGVPVAILLLRSIDPEKLDKNLRPLYDQFMLRVPEETGATVNTRLAIVEISAQKPAGKKKHHKPVTHFTA